MTGKSSIQRRATDALNASMTQVFEAAGAEYIEPDIIQPADVFLERSGEHIRSRTYVFADPSGAQLCLRPDLTVPACRYHLEQASDVMAATRYCYAGKAFRHSKTAADTSLREFDQVGLELFGGGTVADDDAETLALTLAALDAASVSGYSIQLGDLGLFTALLSSIDMPERWRTSLRHQFWRPRAFRDLLNRLTGKTPRARTSISDLLDEMADSTLDAVSFVENKLEADGLEMIAGRSIEQVAGRLSEKLDDRSEPSLSGDHAKLIDDYLSIRCSPSQAVQKLKQLGARTGSEFASAIDLFDARFEAIQRAGLETADMEFAAVFGRSLEYYTGFVFQIDRQLADGASETIAGGGRYDTMLKDIGADAMIPAVGCAIYASRLVSASEAVS
ncbi:MAG: ATP phosphoribosyltransferase regulatory subunit [Anderseniella sp.]|nr:ATP phosphoribosyltransferase regulatory subunit [Anderseniella sp.]